VSGRHKVDPQRGTFPDPNSVTEKNGILSRIPGLKMSATNFLHTKFLEMIWKIFTSPFGLPLVLWAGVGAKIPRKYISQEDGWSFC